MTEHQFLVLRNIEEGVTPGSGRHRHHNKLTVSFTPRPTALAIDWQRLNASLSPYWWLEGKGDGRPRFHVMINDDLPAPAHHGIAAYCDAPIKAGRLLLCATKRQPIECWLSLIVFWWLFHVPWSCLSGRTWFCAGRYLSPGIVLHATKHFGKGSQLIKSVAAPTEAVKSINCSRRKT